MGGLTELTTRARSAHRHHILTFVHLLLSISTWLRVGATTQELVRGFTAAPNPEVSSFQALLDDPTGNFSLGFLRVDRSKLALAILHVPSAEPVWLANPTRLARWSEPTRLFFNGSLVLSDPHTGVFWTTQTNGDRMLLFNTSNLQTLDGDSVTWKSFDFPSDTVLENQNFTVQMSLISLNGLYSMRLGDDYLGLYAKFKPDSDQIYWKRGAMEAKADIVEGKGPIYSRVSSNGFLGMYQTEEAPVDVQPFGSFQRPIAGIRRLRLETDGNLRGYYWNGSNWVLDFQAISDACKLPSSCGWYGLCSPGNGCACLDDKTEHPSGKCSGPESGDLCGKREEKESGFWVVRRKGVELPYKELMGFEKMESLEECESSCEMNCSCWGAVFNNASRFCYKVDYPIRTLVAIEDDSKTGYFKVRRVAQKKMSVGAAAGIGLLAGAVVICVGAAGFGGYRVWRRKRGVNDRLTEDGLSPVAYRDLASASFRSIELCKR